MPRYPTNFEGPKVLESASQIQYQVCDRILRVRSGLCLASWLKVTIPCRNSSFDSTTRNSNSIIYSLAATEDECSPKINLDSAALWWSGRRCLGCSDNRSLL